MSQQVVTEVPGGDAGPPATGSPGSGPAPAAQRRNAGRIAGAVITKYGLVISFVLVVALFCILRPSTFATTDNARAILQQAAPALILAIVLTVVLVMQDFDLSFGSMIGVGSGLASVLMVDHGMSWPLALLLILAAGLAVGLVNGFLVAVLGASSFIITLAMGTVLLGVEFSLTNQKSVFDGFPQGLRDLVQGSLLFNIGNQFWIALVVAVIGWLLLEKSEAGRFMYAIGSSREAARLAGLRVRTLRIAGFVIVGIGAAGVGVLLSGLSNSYAPGIGPPYLLPAFAAVFLGAAAFRPGQFNVLGTVVGVLLLGVIQTGLTMLNLQTFVINLVQGAILIVAVLLSGLGQRLR
jgi:ribose transport system permease protein